MVRDENSQDDRPRRGGRRPGSTVTRQAILDAARFRFAEDGYAAATVRRIAAEAGVDASLVMQFYGSKDELFAAAMALPPEALTQFALAFEGPAATLGERVTDAFLNLWVRQTQTSEPLTAMLRSAISHERAATSLKEFIQARLTDQLGPKLPSAEDAALRAGIASAMLVGIVVGRGIIRIPALADAEDRLIAQIVAPVIQKILVIDNDMVDK